MNRHDLTEKQKAEALMKISGSLDGWENEILDLSLVQPVMLIQEVKVLVMEVCKEREKLNDPPSSSSSGGGGSDDDSQSKGAMTVTYQQFGALVKKCLKKREGGGKAYVYAPRKRPEVALKMISNERAQETFCPQIDPVSDKLSRRKGRDISHGGSGSNSPHKKSSSNAKSIEDILLAEGEKSKERVEKARQELNKKEESRYSFKPVIIKAPKYVKPKYRGLRDDDDASPNPPPPPLPAQLAAEVAAASKKQQQQQQRGGGGDSAKKPVKKNESTHHPHANSNSNAHATSSSAHGRDGGKEGGRDDSKTTSNNANRPPSQRIPSGPPPLPCESSNAASSYPNPKIGSLNSDFDEEVSGGFAWKEKGVGGGRAAATSQGPKPQ